ncbi:hypothetical protein Tco_0019799 [Tanacetum coccineum]
MFKQDPKSAKVSKGLESPSLQGRVNSLGCSIHLGISHWMNADLFLPSSKLSTYCPGLHYTLEHELGLQELLDPFRNVCILNMFESIEFRIRDEMSIVDPPVWE